MAEHQLAASDNDEQLPPVHRRDHPRACHPFRLYGSSIALFQESHENAFRKNRGEALPYDQYGVLRWRAAHDHHYRTNCDMGLVHPSDDFVL